MGSGSDEIDELRQQIDESRENLGSAVGALAYKGDVKNRGKEVLEDKKEAVMDKVDDLKSKLPTSGSDGEGGLGDTVKDKLPDAGAIKDKLPDPSAIKDKLPDGASDAAAKIADKTPSTQDVKDKAHSATSSAAEHPLAVAAGAAAAGLAAGLAVPETELERQKLKPHAQQARADATNRVQDTVQQVKSGAQDAAGSVTDAIKEQSQQQGGKIGEVAEKAADKTQEKINPDS